MQYFTIDPLSIIMTAVLVIVLLPVIIHSVIYFRTYRSTVRARLVYTGAMTLLAASLFLGYISGHIAMTWVFTEITTLAAGALVYHHREELALEAVWKYVFVCAISVTFIFIGILFWSLAMLHCGCTDLSYTSLMLHSAEMDPRWTRLGFLFIFAGYTAKMGLFPMFTAGIDAKDNAPTPAAAMLSSVLMNLGFVGIFRAWAVVSAGGCAQWGRAVLIAAAMVTLFIATTYMVRVVNMKRLLAYSSIEHASIVLLGLCFGRVGVTFSILHLVMHSFVKCGLFLHFGQMAEIYRSKMMDRMGGYLNINPFGALVLLLGLFSVTAVPPSGMFMSELGIFRAMIASGNVWAVILTAFFLTVLIWAVVKGIITVIFIPRDDSLPPLGQVNVSWAESITQLLLFALAIYIGYCCPGSLMDLVSQTASMII